MRDRASQKAKFEELSNNISDRSEAKGTGKLSDSLLSERSEVSGKSALYCIIYVDIILLCETDSSIARAERVRKAKFEEPSNNISDRSRARGTGVLSDLPPSERSEVSGKLAIY